jgi:hypothetical protein
MSDARWDDPREYDARDRGDEWPRVTYARLSAPAPYTTEWPRCQQDDADTQHNAAGVVGTIVELELSWHWSNITPH